MVSLKNISLEEKASFFDSHGFDLVMEKRIPSSLSVEEAVISALIDSKPEPRLLEGVPILLAKNKIDYRKLRKMIDRYQVWNEFGYFGDFALKHFNNPELKELVQYCYTKLKPLQNISRINFKSLKKFRSKEERYWQIKGAPLYEELEQQFRRYMHE